MSDCSPRRDDDADMVDGDHGLVDVGHKVIRRRRVAAPTTLGARGAGVVEAVTPRIFRLHHVGRQLNGPRLVHLPDDITIIVLTTRVVEIGISGAVHHVVPWIRIAEARRHLGADAGGGADPGRAKLRVVVEHKVALEVARNAEAEGEVEVAVEK